MRQGLFHADDWGMSPAINEGILKLARTGRLRSASCIVNGRFHGHKIAELIEHSANGVEIYLHLNLTFGEEFGSHKLLLLKSVLGLIDNAQVRNWIDSQLATLKKSGLPVVGVNGHHHVHLLPGVSEPLQQAMLEHGIKKLLVLDDPSHVPSYLQTKLFRRFWGSQPGIDEVSCGYLRPSDLKTRKHFDRKLAQGKLPLLVHPALWNDLDEHGINDSLKQERVSELKTILGYINA